MPGHHFFYEVNSNIFIFLIKKGSEWKRGGVTIKKYGSLQKKNSQRVEEVN